MNQYLRILELEPGATKLEIKRAYRELSKRYHPDVSKDENAREKFIEINEAYKFLTDVGPRPATINASAPAYDYDPKSRAYEDWRVKARAFAQRRAREAIRRQGILIKSYLRGFDMLLIVIVVFNLFLILDSHLPLVAFGDQGEGNHEILKASSTYFDILFVNDHVLHLEAGVLDPIRKMGTYQSATVYATPILDKPLYLDLMIRGKNYRFEQSAGVYGFFAVLIKIILLLGLIYKIVMRTLDAQLTMSILLMFVSVFQLLIFIKY